MFNVEVHKRAQALGDAAYAEAPHSKAAAYHRAYAEAMGQPSWSGLWACLTCGHPEAEHDGLEECRAGDCGCRRFE